MPGGIRREDIEDVEIVDAGELASDGTTTYVTGATVVSTTAATKRIVFSGVDLIYDKDERAESGDKVTLSGTSGGAADGTYTIDSVIDSVTVDVVESISDSTGGAADLIHPPGAGKVGCDPTTIFNVTADNVQEALEQLSDQLDHNTLRHLIHFVEANSPGSGFGAGPYVSEVLPAADPFPTSETWYTDGTKTSKICRWEGTYNANKTLATETWIVYKADGTSKSAEAVDTISYSGIFETSRSRAVTVY